MIMELLARPCPVCGSRDESRVFAEANVDPAALDEYAFASRKLPEYMHYRLLCCPVCDLLYASPVPGPEALAAAYQDAAYDSAEEAGWAARTYARCLPAICARLPDRDGALDIGAGDGAFLERLIDQGFTRVCGVEPSAAPIAAAPARIRPLIRQGMFRPDDYAEGSLSLVTCFQTIEHLHDPLAMCRAAYRLLKPGGALFLVCHNRRALSAWVLGRRSPIFDVEHLQLFSRRSAGFMLARAGFGDLTWHTVYNRYPLHYWLKLLPLPRELKRRLRDRLQRLRAGHVAVMLPAGNMAIVGYKQRTMGGGTINAKVQRRKGAEKGKEA